MTRTGHRFLAVVGLVGAMALGGCAYDDGYGYGGVSVGTGYYGGGGYDDGAYYGSNYYAPGYYGGWYNNYYYPGSGYYIYDRGGRRQRWDDGQRRYWEGRRDTRGRDWRDGRPRNGGPGNGRPGNWNDRNGDGRPDRGNWTGRPQQPQGDQGRGRGDGVRAPQQSYVPRPVQQQRQPGTDRPQGDRGARAAPRERSDGPRGDGGGSRRWRRSN